MVVGSVEGGVSGVSFSFISLMLSFYSESDVVTQKHSPRGRTDSDRIKVHGRRGLVFKSRVVPTERHTVTVDLKDRQSVDPWEFYLHARSRLSVQKGRDDVSTM